MPRNFVVTTTCSGEVTKEDDGARDLVHVGSPRCEADAAECLPRQFGIAGAYADESRARQQVQVRTLIGE